jgi:hypothetical protein
MRVLDVREESGSAQGWKRRDVRPKRMRELVGRPTRRVGSRAVEEGRKVRALGTWAGVGRVV